MWFCPATLRSGVSIIAGVAFAMKNSFCAGARDRLEVRSDVDDWFWAKLSVKKGVECQGLLGLLEPGDSLEMQVAGGRVRLLSRGVEIATLCKSQSKLMRAGFDDGRTYDARIFEVRERSWWCGSEPVVAILLAES